MDQSTSSQPSALSPQPKDIIETSFGPFWTREAEAAGIPIDEPYATVTFTVAALRSCDLQIFSGGVVHGAAGRQRLEELALGELAFGELLDPPRPRLRVYREPSPNAQFYERD